MRLRFLSLLLALSMVFMTFSIFSPTVKSADNEIYVNVANTGFSDGSAEKPYTTIQKALDEAEEGDTIYVFSGIYKEDLIIDKKVKIWGGIDGNPTIIDTRFDRRYMVEITADEVTIEDVTFSDEDGSMTSPIGALLAIKSDNNQIVGNKFNNTRGYGIYIYPGSSDNLVSNNIINHTKRGIFIEDSSTNDIANNEIHNSSRYGIYMENNVGNNRLYSNGIYNCPYGIHLESSSNLNVTYNTIVSSLYYAMYLLQCQDGLITNNIFKDCQGDGIYLKSNNFYLKNNTFKNNARGINIVGSDNIVKNNTFKYLSASGIYVQSGYNNNVFYLNKFRSNGVSAKDYGNNNWYYLSKGNYWSDYNNIDEDEDGIGDVYYEKNGVVDKYPLGYFLKPPDKASDPSPEDTETGVGLQVTLEVTVTDPDSEYLDVYFYNGDDGTLIDSLTPNPKTHVLNNSEVECQFTLGFNRPFAWYVVIDDGLLQNTSDVFFFYTIKTPPNNAPPVANSGGPYQGEAKSEVIFDASDSYDEDGNIDFYRWNFGDGSSEILQKNPSHIYKNEATYEVTLTVIDNNGSSATDITTASIEPWTNTPPTASFSVPSTGYVNKPITFLSTSTDADDDELTNNWEIGEDINYTGQEISHTFTNTGEYLVTLTVSDGIESRTVSQIISITQSKSSDDDTPGFEIVLVLLAFIAIIAMRKKQK